MKLHFKDNQRGITTVLIVVIALVIAGGAGFFVWNSQKDKDSSNTNQAISDRATEEACNKVVDDKDFCKFASNWAGLTNYTTTITNTTAEGTSVLTVETESTGKNRVVTTQDGKEVAAYITIGTSSYVKDLSDGGWVKYTSDAPNADVSDVKDEINVNFSEEDKIEYKNVGKEKCGDLDCFKYQIIDPDTPIMEQFVWFDTKDYLLRRFTSKEGANLTDMSIRYGNVTITEPSPIKGTPAPTSIDPELQRQIEEAIQASQANEE